jgi:osmotically inducible protein OsmC
MSMAAISRADAIWKGDLTSGSGRVKVASGALVEFPVSWASRAESQHGKTSPEELIAAAHAACYSMAFSSGLSKAGHKVVELNTTAAVTFVPGTGITTVELTVRGRVTGIDDAEFQKLAAEAKDGCPVSKALHGNVELKLEARLES